MHTTKPSTTTTHPLERVLAILGAVVCLLITIPIWWGISAQQSMWPLPGLYFVEMVALSVVSALAIVRGDRRGKLHAYNREFKYAAQHVVTSLFQTNKEAL